MNPVTASAPFHVGQFLEDIVGVATTRGDMSATFPTKLGAGPRFVFLRPCTTVGYLVLVLLLRGLLGYCKDIYMGGAKNCRGLSLNVYNPSPWRKIAHWLKGGEGATKARQNRQTPRQPWCESAAPKRMRCSEVARTSDFSLFGGGQPGHRLSLTAIKCLALDLGSYSSALAPRLDTLSGSCSYEDYLGIVKTFTWEVPKTAGVYHLQKSD
jgi:hypothetical protein